MSSIPLSNVLFCIPTDYNLEAFDILPCCVPKPGSSIQISHSVLVSFFQRAKPRWEDHKMSDQRHHRPDTGESPPVKRGLSQIPSFESRVEETQE